jgi:hypothetical protein
VPGRNIADLLFNFFVFLFELIPFRNWNENTSCPPFAIGNVLQVHHHYLIVLIVFLNSLSTVALLRETITANFGDVAAHPCFTTKLSD